MACPCFHVFIKISRKSDPHLTSDHEEKIVAHKSLQDSSKLNVTPTTQPKDNRGVNKSKKGTNIYVELPVTSAHSSRRNRQNSSDVEQVLGVCSLDSSPRKTSISTDEGFKNLPSSGKKLSKTKLSTILSKTRTTNLKLETDSSSSEEFLNNGEGESTPYNKEDKRKKTKTRDNTGILPNLTYQQVSFPELNTLEEINFIDENIKVNQQLKEIWQSHSEDSILDSFSSESIIDVADGDDDDDDF